MISSILSKKPVYFKGKNKPTTEKKTMENMTNLQKQKIYEIDCAIESLEDIEASYPYGSKIADHCEEMIEILKTERKDIFSAAR